MLELYFAGQIINFKSLVWIIYSFNEFIYFSIYSFAFIYLCIYSLIFFISEWVLSILLIVNRQSYLSIYIEFVLCFMFNYFYIPVFPCVSVSLCLCVFLLVFVCIYVFLVASVLFVFVMYLVWLSFSKTIRVIDCFYPLKNLCKREESLLGILSLEIQTSFSCN